MIIETYSRWLLLSWILTFRYVCKPLRSMYPDMLSLKNAGKLYLVTVVGIPVCLLI